MRALDIAKHKTHLINILTEIFKDNLLSKRLAFKGGTAAMLFYKLPRFSIDLDFDLIGSAEGLYERMTDLLGKNYIILDSNDKFYTLFWKVSYGTGLANIKVEISTRDNIKNHYDLILFYGVGLKVMSAPDMVAHKLIATVDRKITANRDLFDAHYFLGSPFGVEINYEIIKDRAGKTPREFYESLLAMVEKIENKNILDGLGELLTEAQKDWARAKLKEELIGLIQRNIDLMQNGKI